MKETLLYTSRNGRILEKETPKGIILQAQEQNSLGRSAWIPLTPTAKPIYTEGSDIDPEYDAKVLFLKNYLDNN